MGRPPANRWLVILPALLAASSLLPQVFAQATSPASHPAQKTRKMQPPDSTLDAGAVTSGVYLNKSLGFSCKIPPGWVLRTDELNAREKSEASDAEANKDAKAEGGRVLLAAFSRPPEARAEDVNASILIAAESVAAYPGLTDAAQYFGPLSEVAKAQGFAEVGEPYEFPLGPKTPARGDFEKNVGTRVMRQSTLVLLAHGYAVSLTFIGGTEDEVDELIEGLNFTTAAKTTK
jgi:hypothetical protein